MSQSIFSYAPTKIRETRPQYNVLVSPFDKMAEQRRLFAHRGIMSWEFIYENALITKAMRNSIQDFYEARFGSYDVFFLPSFKWDSKLSAQATAGTDTITVEDGTRFSKTTGDKNNRIVLIHPTDSSKIETKLISNISSNTLTLSSVIDYTYPISSEIDVCYVARFDTELVFQHDSYFATGTTLKFIEVV